MTILRQPLQGGLVDVLGCVIERVETDLIPIVPPVKHLRDCSADDFTHLGGSLLHRSPLSVSCKRAAIAGVLAVPMLTRAKVG